MPANASTKAACRTLKWIEYLLWTSVATFFALFIAVHGLRAEFIDKPHLLLEQQDQTEWSTGHRTRYREFLLGALPPVVGTITIPGILTVPIFQGESEVAMTLGAAHLDTNLKPRDSSADTKSLAALDNGNIVLSAHRDGSFRSLRHLKIGDDITLHTQTGETVFRVNRISIVPPTAVHLLNPSSKKTLTLITCFPFYFLGDAPERFVVQAVPVTSHTHNTQNLTKRS